MTDAEILFNEVPLQSHLSGCKQTMLSDIDNLDGDRLLNSSVEDLCEHFVNTWHRDSTQINEDGISRDQPQDIKPTNEMVEGGTRYIFHLPFEGGRGFLKMQPAPPSLSAPSATIMTDELIFEYEHYGRHDAQQVDSKFKRDLNELKRCIQYQRNELQQYNDSLSELVIQKIKKKREKILRDRSIASELQYPLKLREDAFPTYQVMLTKKRVPIETGKSPSTKFEPEPSLVTKHYDDILSIIGSISKVMERNPTSFKNLDEETLRDHILVPLNALYEGTASGETFNGEGKTDILIRVGDKNIFIAECKIWRGVEEFKKAISQLLGYTTWRDTKTAIIVFSRNKDTSRVLKEIEAAIPTHPSFKRSITYSEDTGFRCVLRSTADSNREIVVTILVFDVPK